MKKRVLSLAIAVLLTFTTIPTQAAEIKLTEYEEAVEESVTETEALEEVPVEQEDTSETNSAEEITDAAPVQETEASAEEIQTEEQNVIVQAMEEKGVVVQAEEGETEESVNVVKVGETEYASFADAMKAANKASENETMTILADIVDTDTDTGTFIYSNADTALNIDLNGKTVHVKQFTVEAGTVTFEDKNPAGENYFSKVTVNAGGKVVLKSACLGVEDKNAEAVEVSGTFEMSDGRIAGELYPHQGANVSIEGGYVRKLFLDLSPKKVKVVLTGGEFGSFTKQHGQDVSYVALLQAGYGYKTDGNWIKYNDIDNTSLRYNLTVEKCEKHQFMETGWCENCNYQCPHTSMTQKTVTCPDCGMSWAVESQKDGNEITYYSSLKEAFEKAPDGSTLTLLKDINDDWAVCEIKRNFIVNMGTYSINVFRIYIRTTGALTFTGEKKISQYIIIQGYGQLNLPDDWTGTIKNVYIGSISSKFSMKKGIVEELGLATTGSNISGGTFKRIKNYFDSGIPVCNLLESGYVFKQGNQAVEYNTEIPGGNSLYNVTVEKCEEHRDKDGNNLCDFCNQGFTACVQTTDKDGNTANYSGLQGAFNEAQDDATVKLLADIPARTENTAYIVDKKQLTLDLDNRTISGNGISATNGANLIITGNGIVAGTVAFDSTSQGTLKNGRFGSVISNNPGKTLQNLLSEGYAYRHYGDSNAWETDITETSIDKVEVRLAPIRELEIINSIGELTYGYSADAQQYIQANAILQGSYTMVDYRWYEVNEAGVALTEYVYTNQFFIPAGLKAGKHTYRVEAACSYYILKADVTFEVSKADSKVTTIPTAKELTYTGQDQELVTAGTTSDGELVYSLEKEGTYTSYIPTGNAAQEYTVWYKVKGDSNHNDSASASVKATISYLTTDAVATLADTNKGENGWYTGTVIIQAPEGFTISSTLDGTYAENFTTDVSGENTYYLRQNDSGYTTDAKTIPVKIDTDKPVVGRASMSTHYQVGWYLSNKDIQITQRVEDNTSGPDHVTYTLTPAADAEGTIGTNPASGIAEVDADGSAIITVSKEFKGKIEITPYDKAGNAGDTVTFEKMATEDEASDLKLTDSFTDDWYTTEQTVHVSARDTFSGLYKITYTVDGGKEQTLFEAKTDYDDPMVTDEKEVSFQTQEGTHTYAITAMDNAWNSTTKEITIHQDTQAPTKPTLTIGEAATDTTVTLQAMAEDEASGVKEYILREASGQIPVQISPDGVFALTGLTSDTEYIFTVTAEDNVGFVSEESDVFSVKTRKIPLTNALVTVTNVGKVYNSTAQTPDVEVSVNGVVLSTDQYVVSYAQNQQVVGYAQNQHVVSYAQNQTAVTAPTRAGTYTIIVTASENGDYEGTASSQMTYVIAKKTITARLDGTLEKTYDGTADVLESQKLTVHLNGVESGDEVTATVETYIYNNTNVKDANTITGSGILLTGADAENYQLAETKASVSAKILPLDLSAAEVTLGATLTANGKTQTQTVEKVTLNGTVLTADDYEITGNQAMTAGNYVLTVEGKNNYIGKVSKAYVLLAADTSTPDADNNRSPNVQTGDTAPIEWMLLLIALGAAGIGMMLARKRKE